MKQRIDYFDAAKGILILLVVYGHIFDLNPLVQYAYSFHMPAFFMISGMLLRHSSTMSKPMGQILLDKIYTLIIPFLFFEVLGVLSNIVRFGVTLNFFGYATNTLLLWCNNGPCWFIWSLFAGEMIFFLIHRYLKNVYLRWIAIAAVGAFMLVNHDLYSTFGSTGVGFLFLTFGYYAQPLFTRERSLPLCIAAGVISVISTAVNGHVNLGGWSFGFPPLYILSALSGTFFVLEGSKFLSSRMLNHYGRNSLIVLGTHQAINLAFRVRVLGLESYPTVLGLLVFVGITLIQLPLIHLFNKYIPFLVGRNKQAVFGWFQQKIRP